MTTRNKAALQQEETETIGMTIKLESLHHHQLQEVTLTILIVIS